MRSVLMLTWLTIATVGCSSGAAPISAGVDPVDRQLAQAAKEVVRIRQKSAAIESATFSHDNRTRHFSYDLEKLPDNWQERVVLVEDFYGDIETFVELVSAMSGMSPPRIYGTRPPNPVAIAIYAGERSVIDYLADAGHQAGENIRVMPSIPLNGVIIQYETSKERPQRIGDFYDGK